MHQDPGNLASPHKPPSSPCLSLSAIAYISALISLPEDEAAHHE